MAFCIFSRCLRQGSASRPTANNDLHCPRQHLALKSSLLVLQLYVRGFLSPGTAKKLYSWCLEALPWYSVRYDIRETHITTPRSDRIGLHQRTVSENYLGTMLLVPPLRP